MRRHGTDEDVASRQAAVHASDEMAMRSYRLHGLTVPDGGSAHVLAQTTDRTSPHSSRRRGVLASLFIVIMIVPAAITLVMGGSHRPADLSNASMSFSRAVRALQGSRPDSLRAREAGPSWYRRFVNWIWIDSSSDFGGSFRNDSLSAFVLPYVAAVDADSTWRELETECDASESDDFVLPAITWTRLRTIAVGRLLVGNDSSAFPARSSFVPFQEQRSLNDPKLLAYWRVLVAPAMFYSSHYALRLNGTTVCAAVSAFRHMADAGARRGGTSWRALIDGSVVVAVRRLRGKTPSRLWATVMQSAVDSISVQDDVVPPCDSVRTRSIAMPDADSTACGSNDVGPFSAGAEVWVSPGALMAGLRALTTNVLSQSVDATFHDRTATLASMTALGQEYSRYKNVVRGARENNGTLISVGLNIPATTAGVGSFLTAFNVAVTPSGGVHQLVRRASFDSDSIGGGARRREHAAWADAAVGSDASLVDGVWHMWHTTCDGAQRDVCGPAAVAEAAEYDEVVVLTHR